MKKQHDLAEFIDKNLPKGMYSYLSKPQRIWKITITDWNDEVYFTIEIDSLLGLSQQKTQALTQINNFKEVYNSSLYKLMSED